MYGEISKKSVKGGLITCHILHYQHPRHVRKGNGLAHRLGCEAVATPTGTIAPFADGWLAVQANCVGGKGQTTVVVPRPQCREEPRMAVAFPSEGVEWGRLMVRRGPGLSMLLRDLWSPFSCRVGQLATWLGVISPKAGHSVAQALLLYSKRMPGLFLHQLSQPDGRIKFKAGQITQ